MRSLTYGLVGALLMAVGPAMAADKDPIVGYYGVWVGVSADVAKKALKREGRPEDISLLVQRTQDGFLIKWRPVGDDGREVEMVSLSVVATGEDHIYEVSSANPPLASNAKAEVEVGDGSLVISVTEPGEAGAERVSRYERVVLKNFMTLNFTVTEDGEEVKSVTESLTKYRL